MVDPAEDAVLEELWARVLDAWDDDKSHGVLLEFAARTQTLAAIAARYRTIADDPARGERARLKLQAIATAATDVMLSTRTPRARRVPPSITLTAFATCALLLAWLAWALWSGH